MCGVGFCKIRRWFLRGYDAGLRRRDVTKEHLTSSCLESGMASWKDIQRRNRFKVLCALIAALVVALALWIAGPAPPGF